MFQFFINYFKKINKISKIYKIASESISKINKIHKMIQKDAAQGLKNEVYLLENLFQHNKIGLRNGEKIRIAFLFIIDSFWASWKSFYSACVSDSRFDVTLVFLDMSDFDNKTSQHETAKDFLSISGLPYITYSDYSLMQHKPHVVVYQTPHQWYFKNFPEFKVEYVKQLGSRPIYISYGIEYDTTVNCDYLQTNQFNQPLQRHAWRVFAMHNDIKNGFMLHCPSGGYHVEAFGHPKFDIYKGQIEKFPLSIIAKAKGRKVITYQIHLPNDNDCKKTGKLHTLSFAQTCDNISYLQSRSDIFTIITIHPLYLTYFEKLKLGTSCEFERVKASIIENENTYLYSGQHQILIANSDAFITENSSLMIEMAYFNKPVLYLYDVPVAMKPFAKKIINTFHHGKYAADIEFFIDNKVLGNDQLIDQRIQVQHELFAAYDGRIGERIKDYIFNTIANDK